MLLGVYNARPPADKTVEVEMSYRSIFKKRGVHIGVIALVALTVVGCAPEDEDASKPGATSGSVDPGAAAFDEKYKNAMHGAQKLQQKLFKEDRK
jgi:hypothetical protein